MKKIILVLCLAVSFCGCVSLKGRIIAERNNDPHYQLEAEWTFFEIGK